MALVSYYQIARDRVAPKYIVPAVLYIHNLQASLEKLVQSLPQRSAQDSQQDLRGHARTVQTSGRATHAGQAAGA